MNRLLIFIFFLPLFGLGQSTAVATKAELEKIYTRAIADFISDANKKHKTHFDTLYFGNRKNGQPDDFPDITLPHVIEGIQIRLISPEAGKLKQKQRKENIYINMAGWVDAKNAEFVFFVFSNGFAHQYDYHIWYKYNAGKKAFEMVKLEFKGPPFDK
jgi:hypothetical protein